MKKILIVVVDFLELAILELLFANDKSGLQGYDTVLARSEKDVMEVIWQPIDFLLTDYILPETNAIKLLASLKSKRPPDSRYFDDRKRGSTEGAGSYGWICGSFGKTL